MKLTLRDPPEIGISFLDTITCGVGAIILLMTVTTTRPGWQAKRALPLLQPKRPTVRDRSANGRGPGPAHCTEFRARESLTARNFKCAF